MSVVEDIYKQLIVWRVVEELSSTDCASSHRSCPVPSTPHWTVLRSTLGFLPRDVGVLSRGNHAPLSSSTSSNAWYISISSVSRSRLYVNHNCAHLRFSFPWNSSDNLEDFLIKLICLSLCCCNDCVRIICFLFLLVSGIYTVNHKKRDILFLTNLG